MKKLNESEWKLLELSINLWSCTGIKPMESILDIFDRAILTDHERLKKIRKKIQ